MERYCSSYPDVLQLIPDGTAAYIIKVRIKLPQSSWAGVWTELSKTREKFPHWLWQSGFIWVHCTLVLRMTFRTNGHDSQETYSPFPSNCHWATFPFPSNHHWSTVICWSWHSLVSTCVLFHFLYWYWYRPVASRLWQNDYHLRIPILQEALKWLFCKLPNDHFTRCISFVFTTTIMLFCKGMFDISKQWIQLCPALQQPNLYSH